MVGGADYAALRSRIESAGLIARGALRLEAEERTGALASIHSLVLIGFARTADWDAFAASPEAADGLPDPLDRWSRRVVGALAEATGAVAVYPFGGPPYLPFQRWAQRAEAVFPSPLGLLIHAERGLWHSYRGALGFPHTVEAPPAPRGASPCDTCEDKPCLGACPVGAFTASGYDVANCAAFLRSAAGADCLSRGCRARRACPVGEVYSPDQAAFHMRAFLAAR